MFILYLQWEECDTRRLGIYPVSVLPLSSSFLSTKPQLYQEWQYALLKDSNCYYSLKLPTGMLIQCLEIKHPSWNSEDKSHTLWVDEWESGMSLDPWGLPQAAKQALDCLCPHIFVIHEKQTLPLMKPLELRFCYMSQMLY